MSRQVTVLFFTLIAVMAISVGISRQASANSFGDVGVGAQVVVVRGEVENQAGFGVDIRTRFLWIMGLEFSATSIESSRGVWNPSAYRVGLLIHLVRTKIFHLYLSPGLSGDSFVDAFNPVGDSTWYRLGGGVEFRFLEGLALAAEMHWTVPGERQIRSYVDAYGEELLAEYLAAVGNETEIPNNISEIPSNISTADLLEVLPLDRLEFTIGLRYYFF